MITMPFTHNDTDLTAAGHTVLVIADHSEPVQAVRQLCAQWPQAAQVEWSRGIEHAMQVALLVKPQLILIDAQLQGDGAQIMEKRLARWCASADIYTFVERAQPRASAGLDHQLNWDQLPMLLRAWGQLHSQAFGVRPVAAPDSNYDELKPATSREMVSTENAYA